MELQTLHFYGEPITVEFDQPPLLEKKPVCPDGFTWRATAFRVTASLAEWVDNQRRGRMARNMQPQHSAVAQTRGSWGVGRYYYRVRTSVGRIFEIYYDRMPKDADIRKGSWFLVREFSEETG
jgi:hypothetical protein